MKTVKAIATTALAFALSTAAFAAANLNTFDSLGKISTPTVTFNTQGFSSTNKSQDANVDVFVSGWSLGVIGFDLNGGNLKIKSVQAPAGIQVSLNDASGGANNDRLRFKISMPANTPKGSYTVYVTVENKKFGNQGTIMLMAEVK